MDRNCALLRAVASFTVALRKESVDRNRHPIKSRQIMLVALRKESVDRNAQNPPGDIHRPPSLSARRAWIEISRDPARGSSDTSLSARRAWIEISYKNDTIVHSMVALRKESVDRNRYPLSRYSLFFCRSPQGERG